MHTGYVMLQRGRRKLRGEIRLGGEQGSAGRVLGCHRRAFRVQKTARAGDSEAFEAFGCRLVTAPLVVRQAERDTDAYLSIGGKRGWTTIVTRMMPVKQLPMAVARRGRQATELQLQNEHNFSLFVGD